MDGFTKIIIGLLIVSAITCGIIFTIAVYAPKQTVATSSLVGNFTVQTQQKIGDFTVYSLMWHGGNATVQINGAQTSIFKVYEGKMLPVTVDSKTEVFADNRWIMELTP